MNELALTESSALRMEFANRVEALAEVGPVEKLADGDHVSTEMVAAYFEVGVEAIKSLVKDNRAELELNEYRVFEGDELRSFKDLCGIRGRSRSYATFTERTVLNVAMLLRESAKAQLVRTKLLDMAQGLAAAVIPQQPISRKELARNWYEAEERAELEAARADRAEQKMIEQAPLVAQAEQHRAADGLLTFGDLANKLKAWAKRTHPGVKVLHQEVWDFAGEVGLLIRGNTVRKNRATSFAAENDYIREKESEYEDRDGILHTTHTPRLTPAGEGWLWDRATARIAKIGTLRKLVRGVA